MKRNSQEHIKCNNCGNNNTVVFLDNVTSWEHPGIFRLEKCITCTLVYVNPRPTQSEIGKFYPSATYWGDDVRSSGLQDNLLEVRKKSYGYLYRNILGLKKKGSILDIGAGTGMFLSYFSELGFQTDGVEFSKDACIYARKTFGIKLKQGDFLDKKFKRNTYDIITLNNSLEHLYDPLKTLIELHKAMKKGGMIVVTVPNIESLAFRLFKSNWYALQPPRHLYHFSEVTLSNIMKKAGFRNIEIKRGYFLHNYHTLFESIRLTRSEKFKKLPKGGVVSESHVPSVSLKKEVFKLGAIALAFVLAIFGSVVRRSEVITVIAVK